jgi:GT2 family glycosyltransferase
MKLSVIIPCYNAADTLGQQLEALCRQQWDEPWEVLVVDNGCIDASAVVVEQFRQRLPNLKWIDASAKPGPAYARNVGARHASGEAFAFCDADDEVGPGWVGAMGEALSKHDFVAGKLEFEKLNPDWVLSTRSTRQHDGLQPYTYPPYLPHASSCNLGCTRAVFERVGGFDENMRYLEDTDFCWRVQLAGTELRFVPEAVVHYRLRDSKRQVFEQAQRYGEFNVLLYKRFRAHGMPPLSWRRGVKAWVKLLLRVPWLIKPAARPGWIRQFGWRWGRLKGSIRYRVLAL